VAGLAAGLATGRGAFFFFFFTAFFLFGSLELELVVPVDGSGADWAAVRLPPPVTGLDLSAKSSPWTARDCLGPPGRCPCLRMNPIPSLCFCTEGELLPPLLWSACVLLLLLTGFSATGATGFACAPTGLLVLSDDFLLLLDCGLLLTDKLKLRFVSFCSTTARSFSSEFWFRWTLTGRFLWPATRARAARRRKQTLPTRIPSAEMLEAVSSGRWLVADCCSQISV
jgi:hypothetical protein